MSLVRRWITLAAILTCASSPDAVAQRAGDEPNASLVTLHVWADGTTLRAGSLDAEIANGLRPVFEQGRAEIEDFFGSPFPEPITVTIAPDRAAFSDVLRTEWGIPETACWMVGTGVADFLLVLSPRVWEEEACEHDPADAQHVGDILTHELVHVYHGQRHPSRDFDFEGAEEMGWFIEGLATYVSGQLNRERIASAREALETGAGPTGLRDAWSGRFQYGVSGSMVRFIDERYGRRTLTRLLGEMSNDELLGALQLSEGGFLEAWRAWLRRR